MPSDARCRQASNIICGQLIDLDGIPRLEQANTRKHKDPAVNSLGPDFDTLLTRGAVCALLGAAVWAILVVAAVALEARSRGRFRIAERLGCPRVTRIWLLGVFVALLAATAPANASDTGSGSGSGSADPSVDATVAAALDGLPLPDRATGPGTHAAPRAPRGDQVVVQRGDSLWRIARRLLPDDAVDSAVARAVSRLYAENSDVIGADPDLLVPGQHLGTRTVSSFPVPTTSTEEP
jgi:hypothetical protein